VWQKLEELEKCLLNLDAGDESAVRAVIEEFSTDVQSDEQSILNKYRMANLLHIYATYSTYWK
jgi:3-hydroxyisobutyryl-CoA hydrolase